MDLGTTISTVRKDRGLKQGDLARMAGITPAYLSQIEKNRREPNLSALRMIGEALSIPLPVLFFMALDENDIPDRKKEAFELIGPTLKSMLSKFFTIETTND